MSQIRTNIPLRKETSLCGVRLGLFAFLNSHDMSQRWWTSSSSGYTCFDNGFEQVAILLAMEMFIVHTYKITFLVLVSVLRDFLVIFYMFWLSVCDAVLHPRSYPMIIRSYFRSVRNTNFAGLFAGILATCPAHRIILNLAIFFTSIHRFLHIAEDHP